MTGLRIIILCGLLLFSTGGRGESWPPELQTTSFTIAIDGIQTTVHVPETYDPARPYPLVVAMHGLSDSPAEYLSWFNITQFVDEKEFILIAPAATRFTSWPRSDPVGAVEGITSAITRRYHVDTDRIYLTGADRGARAVFMVASAADHFAGLLTISGSGDAPAAPVHLIHIHGERDLFYSWSEGRRTFRQFQETMQCQGESSFKNGEAGKSRYRFNESLACSGGKSTVFYSIPGAATRPALSQEFLSSLMDRLLRLRL